MLCIVLQKNKTLKYGNVKARMIVETDIGTELSHHGKLKIYVTWKARSDHSKYASCKGTQLKLLI